MMRIEEDEAAGPSPGDGPARKGGVAVESPFPHAGPVAGRQFRGREPLLDRIERSALSGAPVAAVGHRGTGVSSLAAAAAARLEDHGPVARADLEAAPGPRAVAHSLAASLRRAGVEPPEGLDGGDPRPGPQDGTPVPDRVPDDGAGTSRSRPAFLVVDGAQRLADGGRGGPAAALSSAADGGRLVPLCFASRPSAAPRLPGGGGDDAPGGRAGHVAAAGTTARLGPIPLAAWLPFALEAFLETDRWIANEQVEEAVELTGGHPRHTQHLLHLVWAGCAGAGRVRSHGVERAFGRLLAREGHAARALLASLTPNQRRVLSGLAAEGRGAEIFSRSFLRRWELASPSSVQRALGALRERDLLQEGGGGPVPADPVLGAWIRRAVLGGETA